MFWLRLITSSENQVTRGTWSANVVHGDKQTKGNINDYHCAV